MSDTLVDEDGYLNEKGDQAVKRLIDLERNRTKGNMMDVEKMSNEELAGLLEGTEVSYNALVLDESARRLRTAMHWLPMTEDAVFEDKAEYLIRVVDEPLAIVCTYRHKMQLPFVSEIMDYERKEVTHYARITEPK